MIEYIIIILIMFLLLACSAFFSGSETALFSLSNFERRELIKKGRTGIWIKYLMQHSSELLVSILLGNLIINVLLFCVSASLSIKLSRAYGSWWEVIIGVTVLIILIIFGEVLPKAFGLSHATKLSTSVAFPLKIWLKITLPFSKFFLKIINKINNRKKVEKSTISTNELKMLLNYSINGGALHHSTGEMVEDVVELSELRVLSIMTPRVAVTFCAYTSTIEEAVQLGIMSRVYFIPVYQDGEDDVVGLLDVRKLILKHTTESKLSDFIIKVQYIPETKSCGSLLELMNSSSLRTMLVVDEYGGIAGMVTYKDLLEEVIGNIDLQSQKEFEMQVIQLDQSCYRVSGTLSISHWDSFFKNTLSRNNRYEDIATLGGLVVSLLKKYPKVGDRVSLGKIEFLVDEMFGHRIGWIKVRIKE